MISRLDLTSRCVRLRWTALARCPFVVGVAATLSFLFAFMGFSRPAWSEEGWTSDQLSFFELRIRPLLVTNCLNCHGSEKQEGGLRLDSRAAVMKGGDSGPAIDMSNPEASLLYRAVQQTGDLQMPPSGKLPAGELVALKQWLSMRLPWPAEDPASAGDPRWQVGRQHWAFQPVRRPAIPDQPSPAWATNAVDAFISRTLADHQLIPSPFADARTRIRRLNFNLIGLPPDPEAVAEFVSDSRPDAWERLVDRVLARPQYGERWGRHWLDVARYADNKGYVFFEEKSYPWAYAYRDYVIRAWNQDLPYDRFLVEQLAADQLPLGEDRRPLTALGFLTIGGHFMNNTHDILDDRIDVVSRGLLGLTVTCTRCHDHKSDPLSQADYYALYGVFRSSTEPPVPPEFLPPPDTDEYRKFAAEMKAREGRLIEFVTKKHGELVHGARDRAGDYLLATHALQGQPPTENFMLLVDKGDLNPTMIQRWQSYLDDPQRAADPVWLPWLATSKIGDEQAASELPPALAKCLNGQPPVNPLVRQTLLEASPTTRAALAEAYAVLFRNVNRQWQQRLEAAKKAGQPVPLAFPEAPLEQIRRVLYGDEAPADISLSMDWGFLSLFPDRPTQDEYKKLLKEVETWSMTGPGAPPRAMVLSDSERPYEPVIFVRGNPNRPGARVPRRFLAILDPQGRPFQRGSGRLDLAEAIASASNPLTARVIANRLWMHQFGVGLVRTPADYGVRGEPPSHPQLLDWLAAELPANGWSLKRLQRILVTSATFQQSSTREDPVQADSKAVRPETADPENRWLWKMNRRRLEYEAFRDTLFAVTGNLDLQIGGPAVNLWDAFIPRRSIYGHIDRMDLPSLLATFDFPSPAGSSPQRSVTTVPPQSLYLLNNPLLRELADRALLQPGLAALPKDERIVRLYEIFYSRSPGREELDLAQQFLGNDPTAEQWIRYIQGLLMTNELAFVD